MSSSSLVVEALSVRSMSGPLVEEVSFAVRAGEPLTLLGESGSGKTVVIQAIMGALPPELAASGRVLLDGQDLLALSPDQRRTLWGRRLALLPQEPWLALDPTMRLLPQVEEVHRLVRGRAAGEARRAAQADLCEVDLADAGDLYPFQMSGGMCQRAAVAITHAAGSPVLLADEPTKGLDRERRDGVVARLRREVEAGRLLLTITHDVAVARALGGQVGVMLDGRFVEHGPAAEVLRAPRHAHTRALLAADPETWTPRQRLIPGEVVVSGRGLTKAYGPTPLFTDLDVAIRAGEIVAVVGPSGCGKTTLGNVLLGLVRPDAGQVERASGVPRLRYQKLYQDPPAAFAPHQTMRAALDDLARLHRLAPERVGAMLDRLKLGPHLLDRLPGQISGGELQRFALARVLLLDPVFLFADEATSRLDPASLNEVVDLLAEVVAETQLGMLLVTHDPVLAERVADRGIELGKGTGDAKVVKPTLDTVDA
jgi:peptide/nickel transport system ATP-binding protein